jgi:hypothetical protein
MIVNDETRRPESGAQRSGLGWTGLHSWIFLVIVACGLLVVGMQNRYHYLSPLGLGKAYRIDKLFGSIQEFDPARGWVKAQLEAVVPPQATVMMPPAGLPPSQSPSTSLPGTVPQMSTTAESAPGDTPLDRRKEVTSPAPAESPAGVGSSTQAATPPSQPSTTSGARELTEAERFTAFRKVFPDFGKDEFQLANDDLYPDWKKNLKPGGTWPEFLIVYQDFIQWWTDSGSPPEPGFKLWKDYVKAKRRN